MDLHELRGIIRETGSDQHKKRREADAKRTEHFTPAAAVIPENRFNVVLIDLRIGITDRYGRKLLFESDTDLLLIKGTYLRKGNEGRKKDGMSFRACGTPDTADAQTDGAVRKFNASLIVTMNVHTGRMSTGTSELVELNTINDRIVEGLRNKVAILDKNGYHGIEIDMEKSMSVGEWRIGLS